MITQLALGEKEEKSQSYLLHQGENLGFPDQNRFPDQGEI
jgi:hypothetical protein